MSTWTTPRLGLTLLLPLAALACGGASGKSTGDGGVTQTGGQGGTGGQSRISGQGGAGVPATSAKTLVLTNNNRIDILFVLDDWSLTSEIQSKLLEQIPTFVNVFKSDSRPLDLHIAVTTTDMGAPGDVQSTLNCTAKGDGGSFRSSGMGACTSTLASGATYLADDGKGSTNFTGSMADVLQCVAQVGSAGCGFGQPLAAAVRALGADDLQQGTPNPPATNVGFLRPDAYLAIIFLANRDDCSAPANTELFSLQGQPDDLTNPLGPLAGYRCNRFGHICQDPTAADPTAFISPPLMPPSDAQGSTSMPTLDLTGCRDDDTGTSLLTPVSDLASRIMALKADPNAQILVAALTSPPAPYTVFWTPPLSGQNTQAGELWPQIELSCGPSGGVGTNPLSSMFTTDGSAGEPALRVVQFVNGFPQSVLASICNASYANSMQAIAMKIAQLPDGQNCVTDSIQFTDTGLPNCTVTAQVLDGTTNETVSYPNCAANGDTPPCWSLTNQGGGCTTGNTLSAMDAPGAPSSTVTATCTICNPGSLGIPGCG